jgi:hypothetical protein
MKQRFVSRPSLIRSGILAAAIAGFAATPAMAHGIHSDQAPCSPPQLSQPFLSADDTNWYRLLPGEAPGSFDGAGWNLSGGAQIITTQLSDGQTGSVLDLPSGSVAVSPVMCVSSSFPTARTMVRAPGGNDGVSVYVSYVGTDSWQSPQNIGVANGSGAGWTLSDPLDTQPASRPGWQRVRFTLIPGGGRSDLQVYNFAIDPRMT